MCCNQGLFSARWESVLAEDERDYVTRVVSPTHRSCVSVENSVVCGVFLVQVDIVYCALGGLQVSIISMILISDMIAVQGFP